MIWHYINSISCCSHYFLGHFAFIWQSVVCILAYGAKSLSVTVSLSLSAIYRPVSSHGLTFKWALSVPGGPVWECKQTSEPMRIWPLHWTGFPKQSNRTTRPCQISLFEDQSGILRRRHGKVAAERHSGVLLTQVFILESDLTLWCLCNWGAQQKSWDDNPTSTPDGCQDLYLSFQNKATQASHWPYRYEWCRSSHLTVLAREKISIFPQNVEQS